MDEETTNKKLGGGTTLWEINLLSLVAPFSVLILIKFDKWLDEAQSLTRFLCEYVVLALPLLFVFTDVINSFDAVFAFGVVTAFINAIGSSKVADTTIEKKLAYLTNYRASMLLVTAICILGVDFRVFPRRFAKTEGFGFGLMDIGVGSFVFSAGTVSPTSNPKMWNNFKKCLPLIILGILKCFTTKMINYEVEVSEYGVHWNFFITLAIIQLFCGSLTCILGNRRNLLLLISIFIAVGYELWLKRTGMYQKIFNLQDIQRLQSGLDGFVVANIEGIVSLFGYSALFLIGTSLKDTIYGLVQKKNWKMASGCTMVFWTLFVVSVNEGYLILPSRRLCNISYIIWMVAYNLTLILLYAGIEIFTGIKKNPWIYKMIAGYALHFFLAANLLTGLVNIYFQPENQSDTNSRGILAIYTFVLFVFIKRFSSLLGKLIG